MLDLVNPVLDWLRRVLANPHSLFYFQLKDAVTFLVSTVGFMVAFVSLRVNYLAKPTVKPQIGSHLRLGVAGPQGSRRIMLMADAVLFNQGAQAALVDLARIYLQVGGEQQILPWRLFLKTENIAEKGKMSQLFTRFDERAVAVPVPKYDVVVKEIQFLALIDFDLYPDPTPTRICIGCFVLNDRLSLIRRRRREYRSNWRGVVLDEGDIDYLYSSTYVDEEGIRGRNLELTLLNGAYVRHRWDEQNYKIIRQTEDHLFWQAPHDHPAP